MDISISLSNIIGWSLFGLIGMAAFLYGKKQGSWKTMAISAGLMVYPYFVTNTIAMFAVGVALTGSLFYFRD